VVKNYFVRSGPIWWPDGVVNISNAITVAAQEINPGFILDLAKGYFAHVQLEQLAEDIQADCLAGQADKAAERVRTWQEPSLGSRSGIDVLGDAEALRDAFATKTEPLVVFPGALGQLLGNALEREALVGIMAPDKRGKSFWLGEIAFRAICQRRRVAYIEAGDQSQQQLLRRLACRIAKHPLEACTIQYPVAIRRLESEQVAQVDLEPRTFSTPLRWQRAWKAAQDLMRKRVRSGETRWKLVCYPNSTINVTGIRAILEQWANDGWVPDVVIIDYADILAPDLQRLEFRHQQNDTWKRLRALSQELHCLVVTASQTDAAAYSKRLITRANFSEDKRKLAHCTGMLGINQSPEEQDLGISRLNWVVRRDTRYSERRCCHVAGCLDLANPAVISCW